MNLPEAQSAVNQLIFHRQKPVKTKRTANSSTPLRERNNDIRLVHFLADSALQLFLRLLDLFL